MADTYKVAEQLTKHVHAVVAHLAVEIGEEEAVFRVMEHLRTVLMDALEGGRADDMALALKPPAAPGQ